MPGPAPSRNPRRKNARPEWKALPASGRAGDPPAFPIGKPSRAVAEVWSELWGSPQSSAWEDLGWTRVVARYAKLLVVAEKSDASAALLAEVRQLEDRLGLSPMAMKRLQWEIVDGDSAAGDVPAEVTSLDEYRQLYGSG